ncbi:ATP-binding protein [Actinoallomurus soli]|uniref:ATP-binding protein n=1 Tax=Actinoallomurus soli TaxID=2952535 RepID=UPI002092A456|nr:ATP-binding protein [Actinoallomurus soli]MCO5973512.1 ATP-binding protein [Actinoallomurus soli]
MDITRLYEIPRRFDLKMFAYAENVYLVRDLVDQAVDTWGLSENARFAGRLILTELTTNAVRLYEGKEIHVWVSNAARPDLLELAVWDPDPGNLPRILPPTEYGESGRGLALAWELSDRRLGWYRSTTACGKVVWARVGP